jgi:hypothetical protein
MSVMNFSLLLLNSRLKTVENYTSWKDQLKILNMASSLLPVIHYGCYAKPYSSVTQNGAQAKMACCASPFSEKKYFDSATAVSHGDKYEDICVLCCCSVYSDRNLPFSSVAY